MTTLKQRNRKAAAYGVLFLATLVAALYFLAPVTNATGKTEVRQESVCTHSYSAGVKGGTHQQCDTYKTVSRTYCEYRFTNHFATWTSFGGCTQ